MDALLITSFLFIIVSSYDRELVDRLDFFSLRKQAEGHKLYKNLLSRVPTGILIIGRGGEVRFVNDWVTERLPEPAVSRPKDKDGSPPNSNNSFEAGLQSPGDSRAGAKTASEDVMRLFLSSIRTSVEGAAPVRSLYDILHSEGEGLTESQNFVYSTATAEYHFSFKQCAVQYRKELCRALVVNDHSSMHEITKLEDKYRKILLASVVHDIRTPIQGITGILDALNTAARTDEEKQYLRIGQNTCKQLAFLTYDITDLGQLEAGKFKISWSAFSPLEAVQDCVNALSFSYQAKGIQLLVSRPRDDKRVIVSDQHRYMQIVMNLLGNAMKFTQRGGLVTVTLSEDPACDLLTTEVRDTGIGIRTEDLPNLFKLFGKLQSSATLNPQGVGLGLTICRRLSEALGGNITVSSQYGAGSTFVFTVRMCETAPEPSDKVATAFELPAAGSFKAKVSRLIAQREDRKKLEELWLRVRLSLRPPRGGTR